MSVYIYIYKRSEIVSRLRSEETRHINENICINSNVKYMNVWILHNAILTNTNFSLSGLFSSRLKHRSLAVVRSLLLFQPCDKSFILTLSLVRYNVLYWALPEYQIWCTNKSWQRSIRSCKITAHAQFNYLPFFFLFIKIFNLLPIPRNVNFKLLCRCDWSKTCNC